MPTAMYSRGLTPRPVSPTIIERGNQPLSTAARVPADGPPEQARGLREEFDAFFVLNAPSSAHYYGRRGQSSGP